MMHQHTFKLVADTPLTLPDIDHYWDKQLAYICPCGVYEIVTGSFKVGQRGLSHADLEAIATLERRQQTPLARIAQQQRQHRLPHQRRAR